jgi:hypothetical protein
MLAFLNDAWQRAADQANTFRETLLSDQSASLAFVKQGSIASVGKNSANQSYKNYGPGSLTHVQIVEVIGNLLGLYDQLKSKITCEFEASADFDYAVPDGFDFDPPIYDLLTKVFNAQSSGAASMLPDITRLRLPPNTILNPSLVTT